MRTLQGNEKGVFFLFTLVEQVLYSYVNCRMPCGGCSHKGMRIIPDVFSRKETSKWLT